MQGLYMEEDVDKTIEQKRFKPYYSLRYSTRLEYNLALGSLKIVRL
jgi:hypothetical protein